jgi:hypothetical protein
MFSFFIRQYVIACVLISAITNGKYSETQLGLLKSSKALLNDEISVAAIA